MPSALSSGLTPPAPNPARRHALPPNPPIQSMSFYPPSADRLSLRFSGNETVQATETTKTASPTEATSQTSAQPTTYDKQLREFQAVFQRLGVFKKYGNARNLDKRFHELPDPIREKIATILKDGKLTPQDMERYFKEHKMGKIEECADMAFEFHILNKSNV